MWSHKRREAAGWVSDKVADSHGLSCGPCALDLQTLVQRCIQRQHHRVPPLLPCWQNYNVEECLQDARFPS